MYKLRVFIIFKLDCVRGYCRLNSVLYICSEALGWLRQNIKQEGLKMMKRGKGRLINKAMLLVLSSKYPALTKMFCLVLKFEILLSKSICKCVLF